MFGDRRLGPNANQDAGIDVSLANENFQSRMPGV